MELKYDDDGSSPICLSCGEGEWLKARARLKCDVNKGIWEIFFDCLTCLTSFRKEYGSWYLMNNDWLRYRSREKPRREAQRYVERPDRRWFATISGWVEDKGYGKRELWNR